MNKRLLALLLSLIVVIGCLAGCDLFESYQDPSDIDPPKQSTSNNKGDSDKSDTDSLPVYGYASVEGIPDYSGKPYVSLNGGMPEFTEEEKVTEFYEFYSPLDALGRCGYTIACVGKEGMPTEDRESISSVKPSGWVNNKYSTDLVDGGYVYNRCHLIGFQLTGENANKENLITGTRYLNIEGMLPFENMVADYVKETGNHVMYRVTPVFVGNNLVASGVRIEGWSVEDNGEGICFNVFAYNVQPGVVINYATGENRPAEDGAFPEQTEENVSGGEENTYILNINTKKIHKPDCSSAQSTKEENKREYTGNIEALIEQGYSRCGICKPE